MGIQDRGYLVGKNKGRNRYQSFPRKSGGIRYLLYPALVLGSLWYGADALLKYRATGKPFTWPSFIAEHFPTQAVPTQTTIADINTPEIILHADRQGHFRGSALINGVPMPFMIDTGATKISIPKKMAQMAALPFGQLTQTNTAGGKVTDRLTRIENLRIGNAEIRNLEASINEHLDEVLIGMNALKYFRTTQDGKTMTLVAKNQPGIRFASVPNDPARVLTAEQQAKKLTTIKKTVTCDENKVCRTIYSDR